MNRRMALVLPNKESTDRRPTTVFATAVAVPSISRCAAGFLLSKLISAARNFIKASVVNASSIATCISSGSAR